MQVFIGMDCKIVFLGSRLFQAVIAFACAWINVLGLTVVYGFSHGFLALSQSHVTSKSWNIRVFYLVGWAIKTWIGLVVYPLVLASIVAIRVLKKGALKAMLLNKEALLSCATALSWVTWFSVHRWVLFVLKGRMDAIGMPQSAMTSRLKSGNDEVDFESVVYNGFSKVEGK